MDIETIQKMYEECDDEPLSNDEPNRFLAGLTLLAANAKESAGHDYAAEHDIFYAYACDEIENLTKDDIEKLNRWRWFLDGEYECFAYFT